MVNLLKWPRVWFEIFLKPEETAASLKKEKPSWIEGIISFGFCSFLIGLIGFIISAILAIPLGFTLGAPLAAKAGGMLIGLLIMFAICVIAFPILMIILLLILSVFLKIASVILKGKGSLGGECGILGIVGSSFLILTILTYAIMLVPMIVLNVSNAGFVAIALIYMLIGIAILLYSPLMYLLTAFLFDLLADIEKVTIYKSGAMFGLMYGIVTFIMMLFFAVFMFIAGMFTSNM